MGRGDGMVDREKVIKGLECCMVGDDHSPKCELCPYATVGDDTCQTMDDLFADALVLLKALDVTPDELERLKMCRAECKIDCLLEHYNNVKDELDAMEKAQEPRLITVKDFENNPNVDHDGFLPAWIEYRRDGDWDEYWEGQPDEWGVCKEDRIVYESMRYWTSRPTDEMRRETPWEMK